MGDRSIAPMGGILAGTAQPKSRASTRPATVRDWLKSPVPELATPLYGNEPLVRVKGSHWTRPRRSNT